MRGGSVLVVAQGAETDTEGLKPSSLFYLVFLFLLPLAGDVPEREVSMITTEGGGGGVSREKGG